MNHPRAKHEPTPSPRPIDLDALLREAAPSNEQALPPPEFLERCRSSGRRAAELQRLRTSLPLLGNPLSPLRKFLRLLADLAQVQLDALLATLVSPRRAGGALVPWIRLGHTLGLPPDEIRRRVRLEFAPRRWFARLTLTPTPAVPRRPPDRALNLAALERDLAREEATYAPRRRRDLDLALAAVDVLSGHDRN